jgi:hypothetical protein
MTIRHLPCLWLTLTLGISPPAWSADETGNAPGADCVGDEDPDDVQDEPDDPPKAVLDRLNAARRARGLRPVRWDPALAMAELAHAQYLVFNHDRQPGLDAHQEYPGRPGYTALGKDGGAAVLIHRVQGIRAVDGWINSVYHSPSLLAPRVEAIGYDSMAIHAGLKGRYPLPGEPAATTWAGLACIPHADERDVPVRFAGEHPNPIPDADPDQVTGPVIMVCDFGGAGTTLLDGHLTDAAGRDIPVWRLGASPGIDSDSPTLLPKDPLQPGATYHVTMALGGRGGVRQLTWSFTTHPAPARSTR